MGPDLYPHQLKALQKLRNGCILCGGVGTGKTRVALAYYLNNESYERLIVITTAKKRDSLDWEAEAAKFGIGKEEGASLAGVMTVDSWNNIAKYTEVKDAFFIFDEQRLVGSGAWVRSFIKITKQNQWILLSATPGDTWLDYIPVFVGNGFYKNRTEFKREHVVYNNYSKFPKVERYLSVGKLVRLKNQITVDMPYERHTVRHVESIETSYDEESFLKATRARWNVFEERPMRDVAELFLVMRKIVNSDASRLAALKELMVKHPRLVVFYNFDYELEILRTLSGAFPLAEATDEEKQCQSIEDESSLITPSQKNGKQLSRSGLKPLEKTSRTLQSTSYLESTHPHSEKLPNTTQRCNASWINEQNQLSDQNKEDECGSGSKILQSSHPLMGDSQQNNRKLSETSSNFVESSSRFQTLETVVQDSRIRTNTSQRFSDLSQNERRNQSNTTSFEMAEWNGHKHEPIPDSDRWVYLVQYAAGSESWNCTSTNAMVFYSLTYSYKMFEQAKGRIDRLDTPFVDLHYYVFVSNAIIDRAILKSLKNKQSFNESTFYPKTDQGRSNITN